MRWGFNNFVLDKDKAEIIGPDGRVSVERLPFDLLVYLVECRDRIVSRDDLIKHVWGGRIVSDATMSTAVKLARKAVGDNGVDQAVIRTIHGRGFRFVADLKDVSHTAGPVIAEPITIPDTPAARGANAATGKPSIAVLRFQFIGADPAHAGLGSAFPTELLASLSRMRWLHVVARGSSFQLDPERTGPAEVADKLGVKFILSGLIEAIGAEVFISVELQAARDGALVWSERFPVDVRDIHRARQGIVASVVAVLENEVPQYEASQLRRMTFSELDAWSHFHMGLSHIYKFKAGHTQSAQAHFLAALELDPEFARAHAGLSFTHWQNAFMRFGSDREQFIDLAVASADRALGVDPNDPFANFNMGRACWLNGDVEESEAWLSRAVQINPNYAQGHYNKGLILALDGASTAASVSADKAMALSPLDPLYYAMLSVQSICNMIEEDFGSAVALSDRAMQSPGAHFYIALIAACANELDGNRAGAERRLQQALRLRPDATAAMFLAAFPFRDARARRTMTGALNRLGVS